MDAQAIGKHIALLRKENGYTQEELAELLGISPQAVGKWEKGQSLPMIDLLPDLSKLLKVSICQSHAR